MALMRKKPRPLPKSDEPPLGDESCAKCGQPGSVCPDCGQCFCPACNLNPHVPTGHKPSEHLKAPPVVPETEPQRLAREIRQMEQLLIGTYEDRLRKRHAMLTAQVKRLTEDPT